MNGGQLPQARLAGREMTTSLDARLAGKASDFRREKFRATLVREAEKKARKICRRENPLLSLSIKGIFLLTIANRIRERKSILVVFTRGKQR